MALRNPRGEGYKYSIDCMALRLTRVFNTIAIFTKASPRLHLGCLVTDSVLQQDALHQGGCMRFKNLNFAKFATYMVLVIGLSASAFASCGDLLSAIVTGNAGVTFQSGGAQPDVAVSGATVTHTSIVGLWHVEFTVNGQTIQEAFQLWNAGGTEVHNPNVDPRSGNVCLGVWKH